MPEQKEEQTPRQPLTIEEFIELPTVEEVMIDVDGATVETFVAIRTAGTGTTAYIPVDGEMTVRQVLAAGNLTITPETIFRVEGQQLELDDVVQPGSTITAIGQVKGG